MNDQSVHLRDILERILRIEEFTAGGQEAFYQSLLIQDAVIRGFEVIGEAVKHLSPELKQAHPGIPWRQIAGFRDVLIHDYGDVDVEEVWDVVEHHIPALKQVIEVLLSDQEKGK